MLNIALC